MPIVKLGNRAEIMYDVFHNIVSVYHWLIKDDNTDKSFQKILNLKIQIHVRANILENLMLSKTTKVNRILKDGENLIKIKMLHYDKLKEIQNNFTSIFNTCNIKNKTKQNLLEVLN
jgi:hypothetical protein